MEVPLTRQSSGSYSPAPVSACPRHRTARRHLHLDGGRAHVRVRRALVRGRVEPPKSRHGRRDVPLAADLVRRLRAHLADVPDTPEALVFASRSGLPLDSDNLRRRTIKPLMDEAGAAWAPFHTLRHTYASLQLSRGVNVVQLSRALGAPLVELHARHYVHLLEGEEAPALDLGEVTRSPGNITGKVA